MNHTIVVVALAALACTPAPSPVSTAPEPRASADAPEPVAIDDVAVAMELAGTTVFIDPVGDRTRYARFGRPDIVVLTSPSPDHLSVDTMIGLLRRDTVVLAPRSVIDLLPLMISNNVIEPFDAGDSQTVEGIAFAALPASAEPPPEARVHGRRRGEIGVVVETGGTSLYF